MATVADIVKVLELNAPASLQESYDNSGLLTGDSATEVKKILLCLDSTEAVIDEAVTKGCEMIIAHHPIIWKGLKRITGRSVSERVAIKAIRNNIAIYAFHTNFDKVVNGVNSKICEKLDIMNPSILLPERNILKKLVTFVPATHAEALRNGLFHGGAGAIGNYAECSFSLEGTGTFMGNQNSNPYSGTKGVRSLEPETRIEVIFEAYKEKNVLEALRANHPYEEIAYDIYALDNDLQTLGSGMVGFLQEEMEANDFLAHVKGRMQTNSIRYFLEDKHRKIHKIAVCGGAGHFLLASAKAAGADAFITSDVKYHEIMEAENHLLYADIGHYESEIFTIELFYDIISKKFQ